MATIGSAKATLVNKIDSLTSSATAKDTIFLAKALKENTTHHSFTFLGAWAASTAYALDDVVTTSGKTYICILAYTPGSSFAVGSNWSLMAEEGTNGTNGTDVGTGTAGQVLKTDAAGTGIEWGADEGGKILQVLSVTKTDTWSVGNGGNTWTDITGLSLVITPISASSKILVQSAVSVGTSDHNGHIRLERNGTAISIATGVSNRLASSGGLSPNDYAPSQIISNVSTVYLDSPNTTSAVTYGVAAHPRSNGATLYINRNGRDTNTYSYDPRVVSSITIMEVSA